MSRPCPTCAGRGYLADSGRRLRPVAERFWFRVIRDPETDCWEWLGALDDGYGFFWDGERRSFVHRYAYGLLVGPIPEGLVIDHLCRNRGCVNPDHLEAVTSSENVKRGNGPFMQNARKTHCKRGHEFSPENLVPRKDGVRACLTCDRQHRALSRKRHWTKSEPKKETA